MNRVRRKRLVLGLVMSMGLVGLTACSGGSDDKASDGTILVWTDAERQVGFKQFQKENPDIKMKIETFDPASLLTKIQLFNRTKKGWPDVIFSQTPSDAAALNSPLYDFALNLKSHLSDDVVAGFKTTNTDCQIDGGVYCLKNDLAQSVLWYDTKLMDKFGYEVPKTWPEYEALGERVAKEHPGYIVGTAGFKHVYNDFLWSSGCPLQEAVAAKEVRIDTEAEECTRVATMLDNLIDAGSVSREGPFDPGVTKLGQQGKILMLPSAAWYGDFVFKPEGGFHTKPGRLAAAAYPTWPGAKANYSGASGGGVYIVSKHSKNVDDAVKIATWMATDTTYQAKAATYPAFVPAAEAWGKRLETDKFYATNPFAVLQAQASLINPVVSNTRYSVDDAVTATIVQSVRSGGSVTDALPTLQTQLRSLAQSVGYAVK
ncbi:ABC transporter substrate-binding protein [Aeromicrobium sp. Root236]|uniref:ABC transporter substrate-binding protein n=1 Tax=Aeromicrobium sp. Root236 TaxID=1736498 RepID=UPI0009EC5323|nr:ABC transporter substrate-binding protein [Aeromicrobium sp. Root236]